MKSRYPLVVVHVLLIAALAYAQPAPPVPRELPRYHLEVGQELTYETSIHFKTERSEMNDGSTAVFDVVSGNSQDGWHIVGRIASWNVQNGNRQESDKEVLAFDLKPDGSATLAPGALPSAAVPDVFPALPRNRQ
jgi:hypothetical protein